MKSRWIFFAFIFCCSVICCSQIDSTVTLTFDFNEHKIKEKDNKVIPVGEGVTLTADRFGNEKSAVYLHGNNFSYLNLGTSKLLKPTIGSISLWVKLDRKVYTGTGYEANPLIITKNSEREDFYDSYIVFYDLKSERFMGFASKDSTEQAGANSINPIIENEWCHLVLVYDNHNIGLYLNGELQLMSQKTFETKFNPLDSVVVGNTASVKNSRCTRGVIDDIQIFHRVLSDKEVYTLYNSPNPNKFKNIVSEILRYGVVIFILIIIIIGLIIRNKRVLKRQKEQLELVNKITELELKVVKTQMNPHFISNCLAAIQELIYKGDIDKAGQYIAKFSYFLRKVLHYSDKNYISLSEELEIVKLNVELEQLRFKNEFIFDINIDEKIDMDLVLIPSLITQPFIENAIWHGLLPLKNLRKPILKIHVFLLKDLPVIEIEDNGVGRYLQNNGNENSKGTKLVADKIESLNRLNHTLNYKMEIIDLIEDDQQVGTKIRIQLDSI